MVREAKRDEARYAPSLPWAEILPSDGIDQPHGRVIRSIALSKRVRLVPAPQETVAHFRPLNRSHGLTRKVGERVRKVHRKDLGPLDGPAGPLHQQGQPVKGKVMEIVPSPDRGLKELLPEVVHREMRTLGIGRRGR